MEEGKKTVVVAGATGRTGKLVAEELLERGFAVRALVRSASKASWLEREGLQLVEGDITSVESLERAIEGADFVISAIGSKKPFSGKENNRVDNMGNQNLARAAKSKGIQHLVVISSIGVGDSRYAVSFVPRILMTPVLRMKEKSEDFIRTWGQSYTIIRPGGLKGTELSGQTVFGEGGKVSGSVNRKQIAKVCVDALTKASMKNRTLEVIDASTVKEELHPFLISID